MNTRTQPAVERRLDGTVGHLVWTEPCGPTEGMCHYDHVVAQTPFGRFLITWKGWKTHQWPTVDETPWGDEYGSFGSWPTVEAAQRACEDEFARRLQQCIEPHGAGNQRGAEDGASELKR